MYENYRILYSTNSMIQTKSASLFPRFISKSSHLQAKIIQLYQTIVFRSKESVSKTQSAADIYKHKP